MDGETHVARSEDEESASEAVLRAVAAVSNRQMLDLPPLAGTIDPDALDRLFGSAASALDSVQFGYAGYTVVVTADEVRVDERQ